GGNVPNLHRALTARRGQTLAVRAEREGVEPGVRGGQAYLLTCCHVPQFDHGGDPGNGPAVRAEHEAANGTDFLPQGLLAGGDVPDQEGAPVAPGETAAVGAKGQATDPGTAEGRARLESVRVPHAGDTVRPGRGEPLAAGEDHQLIDLGVVNAGRTQ